MLITEDDLFSFHSDEESLYIRAGGIYCLAPWNADLGCSQWKKSRWQDVSPPGHWQIPDILAPANPYSRLKYFFGQIPLRSRKAVSKFLWMQLPALRLLRLHPHAVELAEEEPFLFWLMAVKFHEGTLPAALCRELFSAKRKKVFEQVLGADAPEKHLALRTLKKLRLKAYTKAHHDAFMTLFHKGLFRHARHAPFICLDTLANMFGESDIGNCALLEEMIAKGSYLEWRTTAWAIRQCEKAAAEAEVPDIREKIRACPTGGALAKLHKGLVELYEKQNALTFPVPPFPPTEDIVPIRNSWELRREGEIMHHCVQRYLSDILKERAYIFRVRKPERATVMVSVARGMWPNLLQISCKYNMAPSPETLERVKYWLFECLCDGYPEKGAPAP